jgi:hypothetical protein
VAEPQRIVAVAEPKVRLPLRARLLLRPPLAGGGRLFLGRRSVAAVVPSPSLGGRLAGSSAPESGSLLLFVVPDSGLAADGRAGSAVKRRLGRAQSGHSLPSALPSLAAAAAAAAATSPAANANAVGVPAYRDAVAVADEAAAARADLRQKKNEKRLQVEGALSLSHRSQQASLETAL